MNFKKPTIIYATCCLIACVSAPLHSEEGKVELSTCYTVDTTVFDQTAGLDKAMAGLHVLHGLTDLSGSEPMPKRMINDCRVLFTTSSAGFEFTNRCSFTDYEGDKILAIGNGKGNSFVWKWIAGSGKFEGIRGSGKADNYVIYPRSKETVAGGCWKGSGSFVIDIFQE